MSGPSAHHAVFGADEEVLSCREAYQFMVPILGEGIAYGAERSVMEEQMKMAQGPLTGKQLRASAAVMAAEAQAYLDVRCRKRIYPSVGGSYASPTGSLSKADPSRAEDAARRETR